jgi:(2R)-phospho-3-sulfolactate synthase (ComA)
VLKRLPSLLPNGAQVNLFVDHSEIVQLECLRSGIWGTKSRWGRDVLCRTSPGPIVRHLFRLYRDLLGATGFCWHVDLFASVCIDDLERGGRIIQPHRFDLGFDWEGVSDG